MLGWIKSRLSFAPNVPLGPIHPDQPFYVVGDIHGCDELLARLLARLDSARPIVFVGDYVDRGPKSADVLHRLKALDTDPERDVTCLLGNHEAMLLGFLNDPQANARWLRFGGIRTLASFGITELSERSDSAALTNARDRFRSAIGADMIAWLQARPLMYLSGNVAVVHAAADPKRAIHDQPEPTLIWGHPQFRKHPRKDGIWIVHGHTIVDQPTARNGVVSVDTGAFATGCLTAALITKDDVEFITG
jgi:serine/threonine protein phosphatase 1